MKSYHKKTPILLFIVTLFTFGTLNAQPQPGIEEQYQEFYDKSNTWEDFKVIKLYRLDEFWTIVSDTIKEKRATIRRYSTEIDSLKVQLGEVRDQLNQKELSLTKSEALNESIAFLGIQVSKTVYNIIVWAIIVGLIVGVVSVYLMFKQSNVITKKTRKDYSDLERENHEIRQKARDVQIKLKRELQTALNRLSEQRV